MANLISHFRSGVLFFSSALVAVGCASGPKVKVTQMTEGQWRAKALVKDREAARSYIVNLNMNAVKGERARMDVSSALGFGVASMLVEDQEVRYILFDSKRFYYGRPQPDVMRPIFSLPFDPRWLHNILFEIPIAEKSWTCVKDARGSLVECQDSVSTMKITWSGRSGDNKTITITHPKATLQINVNSVKPKVEDRKNLFQLEAPEGYQRLRVR